MPKFQLSKTLKWPQHLFCVRAILFALVLLTFSCYSFGQNGKTYLSLTFIGDIMQHGPQIRGAYDPATDSYDYSSCFQYIAPSIRKADIAIANLEVTLAGPPFSGYPTFSSPDELAVAAKNAGIDILITANNHSLDRRRKGLERTINVLDSLGIPHTGTFKNAEMREKKYPLIIEKKGIKIALLTYTYGTNGIPVTPPNVVNFIDTTQMKADIKRADKLNADFTIAVFHWGYEYNRLPNRQQKMLVKFSKKHGVDMVIGGHPHVLQPVEFEDGFLAVYSLGNFVSNQRDRYKDGGMIATATLEIDEASRHTKAVQVSYQLVWVYKKTAVNKSEYYILPAGDYSSKAFISNEEDRDKMKLFVEDSRELFAKHNKGLISEYRYVFSYMPSFDLKGNLKYTSSFSFLKDKNQQAVEKETPKKVPEVRLPKHSYRAQPVEKEKPPMGKAKRNVVYRIQFFVSSGELETGELPKTYFPKIYEEKVGPLTRYLTGDYSSKQQAEKQLAILISETKFKDAYVVAR